MIKSEPSKSVAAPAVALDKSQNFLLKDDLKGLSPAEKAKFYLDLCTYAGIDPITKPFGIYDLSGREVLYIKATGADQLAIRNKVSRFIVPQEVLEGGVVVKKDFVVVGDGKQDEHYLVKVRAERKIDGEMVFIEDVAMVRIWQEKKYGGQSKGWIIDSNAYMKAVTKAMRRSTLKLVGLHMPTEDDIEDMKHAKEMNLATGNIVGGSGDGDILDMAFPSPQSGFKTMREMVNHKGDEELLKVKKALQDAKDKENLSEQWNTILERITEYCKREGITDAEIQRDNQVAAQKRGAQAPGGRGANDRGAQQIQRPGAQSKGKG